MEEKVRAEFRATGLSESGTEEFREEIEIVEKRPNLVRGLGILFNADVTPLRVVEATFTILRLRLKGERFRTEVKSTGLLPLFGASITQDLRAEGQRMFEGAKHDLGGLGGSKVVEVSWEVGGIGAIVELFRLFITGRVRANLKAKVNAFRLSKNFDTRAVIPVDRVNWKLL